MNTSIPIKSMPQHPKQDHQNAVLALYTKSSSSAELQQAKCYS